MLNMMNKNSKKLEYFSRAPHPMWMNATKKTADNTKKPGHCLALPFRTEVSIPTFRLNRRSFRKRIIPQNARIARRLPTTMSIIVTCWKLTYFPTRNINQVIYKIFTMGYAFCCLMHFQKESNNLWLADYLFCHSSIQESVFKFGLVIESIYFKENQWNSPLK